MSNEGVSLSVDFCRVLEASSSKWIFYMQMKKPDTRIIGVTDGVDVWQQNVTKNLAATDFTNSR